MELAILQLKKEQKDISNKNVFNYLLEISKKLNNSLNKSNVYLQWKNSLPVNLDKLK